MGKDSERIGADLRRHLVAATVRLIWAVEVDRELQASGRRSKADGHAKANWIGCRSANPIGTTLRGLAETLR